MGKGKLPEISISNGVKLPALGYGTATVRGEDCIRAVQDAIDAGFRLIDTASEYGNEESVGEAIRECGVDRSELLISSKLWNDAHSYDGVMDAFKASCKRLGIDYLDIYLIHWPNPVALRNIGYEKHNSDAWRAMEELYEAGKIRAIGISNFQVHHMEALLCNARIKPMINQICLHPGRIQREIVDYCRKSGMALQAYCPLGAGKLFGNAEIDRIAETHDKDPGQVILRWHFQNGFIPLPRTVRKERMESNIDIFDFKLSEEEMKVLDELDVNVKILPDPDEADF